MAQSGEATAYAQQSRVPMVQKWIVAIAIGCIGFAMLLGLGITLWGLSGPWISSPLDSWNSPPQDSSQQMIILLASLVLMYMLTGFGWLSLFAGRGLLMYLRPLEVQGQLRTARERTGLPRLYGLAMIWSGVSIVLAWWLFGFYNYQQPSQHYSAVFDAMVGLYASSIVPLTVLEAYGLWRRRTREHSRWRDRWRNLVRRVQHRQTRG